MAPTAPNRWLLLVHQLPPTPAYLRAKVGRQLARVGAVAVKNSVYVLPDREGPREDFQWIAREIQQAEAEATIFEAELVEGLSDDQLVARFHEAVAPAWKELRVEIRSAAKVLRAGREVPELGRLRRRAEDIEAVDFFHVPLGREVSEELGECERLAAGGGHHPKLERVDPKTLVGKTWATRRGIHVDRIGSAWFVRRFVDPEAAFVFLSRTDERVEPGVLRFDMSGGEFTHEGDLCSFEVLLARTGLEDPGLRAVGEIVHDLDLKDGRHGRAETVGVGSVIAGLCQANPSDEERLAVGCRVFDALYEHFRRREPAADAPAATTASAATTKRRAGQAARSSGGRTRRKAT